MKDKIIKKLGEIEEKEKVTILYAIESGSRGWGFASKDSDYDVRFVYAHDLNWYLSIDEKEDVIEYPRVNSLDISGWDIKKALQLFKSSNPPLYEWLTSPIIYHEKGNFAQQLRELMPLFYSPTSCLYHYLHMAKRNYREYLRGEKVRVKKYFYVLRPILASIWIEAEKTMPPMEFERLLHAQSLDKKFIDTVEDLLKRKRAGEELNIEDRIEIINNFLEAKITYFEAYARAQKIEKAKQTTVLDELFRNTIVF